MHTLSSINDATKPAMNLKSLLKTALSLVVICTIIATAWNLSQRLDLTSSLLTSAFVLSTLLAIIYRVVNPVGWAMVLRGFGFQVNFVSATRVWLHAESRRWLPGGVWGYASRAVASKELGVPVSVASSSMLIELLLTIAAAAVVSLFGIAMYWNELSQTVERLINQSGMTRTHVAVGLVAIFALISIGYASRNLFKQKLNGLSQKFSALRRMEKGTTTINAKIMLTSLAYFIVMACLNGLVNQTLIQAIDGSSNVPIVAMIAATATAWIIGFFAFFSPGGMLVREAALAALLLPWMPYEIGFSLAMLSRFAQLIAEVVAMLAVIMPVGAKFPRSENLPMSAN